MPDSPYSTQIESNILSLLNGGNFAAAYTKVNDLISLYPDNEKLFELKREIERRVEIQNRAVIEQKLAAIKPLWDKPDYAEILRELKAILDFAPNHEKVKKLYLKAQNEYRAQVEKLQKKFEKEKASLFDDLLKSDPERLLDELNILEQGNPGNPKVHQFIKKYRRAIIIKKIADKHELLNSDKFREIKEFLDILKKIDRNCPEIAEVESHVKIHTRSEHLEEKKEYIYKGKEYLDTLLKLKKYDKAIHVAEEILELDPGNGFAAAALKTARHKFFHENQGNAIDQIAKNAPLIQAEYSSTPSNFLRIY